MTLGEVEPRTPIPDTRADEYARLVFTEVTSAMFVIVGSALTLTRNVIRYRAVLPAFRVEIVQHRRPVDARDPVEALTNIMPTGNVSHT